jgi:hypothetical protein
MDEIQAMDLPIEEMKLLSIEEPDIDFDDIKSNEDRKPTNKERQVICPMCDHEFTI